MTFADSRLFTLDRLSTFYSRSTLDFLLSTLDFLLSTLDFLLSTLDFYSRLLLSTLDFYSRLSTYTLDPRLLDTLSRKSPAATRFWGPTFV